MGVYLWRNWLSITSAAVVITGASLILFGAALPWWDDGWRPLEGLNFRNGQITFSLGLVSLVLPALRLIDNTLLARVSIALLGCLCGGLAIALSMSEIGRIQDSQNMLAFVSAVVGSGLYFTVVGGGLVIAGSLMGIAPDRSAAPSISAA